MPRTAIDVLVRIIKDRKGTEIRPSATSALAHIAQYGGTLAEEAIGALEGMLGERALGWEYKKNVPEALVKIAQRGEVLPEAPLQKPNEVSIGPLILSTLHSSQCHIHS